jgi:hypothetical protein
MLALPHHHIERSCDALRLVGDLVRQSLLELQSVCKLMRILANLDRPRT